LTVGEGSIVVLSRELEENENRDDGDVAQLAGFKIRR
jgi:hypothetical protein